MNLGFSEAKLTLLQHAGHVDLPNRRSLIASLRPFSGIHEEDFREVFVSLISLHDNLVSGDTLDRGIVYGCWDICTRVQTLALDETAPLRTNGLINQSEYRRLREWHRSIESYCRSCFHKLDMGTCLGRFVEYIGSDVCAMPELYVDFAPLFRSLTQTADFELEPLLERTLARIEAK